MVPCEDITHVHRWVGGRGFVGWSFPWMGIYDGPPKIDQTSGNTIPGGYSWDT